MLDKVTQLVARRVLSNELKLQKKIRYKLVFKNLPKDWIDGYALVGMTLTWHSYGLPIRGLNYFTVGSLKNGLSSRFIMDSDLYQAWLGGYVFQSKKRLYWHSDDYLRLAEADQEGCYDIMVTKLLAWTLVLLKKSTNLLLAAKKLNFLNGSV